MARQRKEREKRGTASERVERERERSRPAAVMQPAGHMAFHWGKKGGDVAAL